MHVIHHATLPRHAEGGCSVQTVADASMCAVPLRVQTLVVEPGSATEPLTAAPARVVIAIAGCGKLVLDSGPERFHAPCTLVVPAGSAHRIVNHGATPLELVCVQATGPGMERP